PWDISKFSNLVAIDDGGLGLQAYRYSQGLGWYGTPGVSMTQFDSAADYTYMQGDYAAAYRNQSGTDPATELVRDVFYLRNLDYVITYDRATTSSPSFTKQLQWHFTTAPTLAGDGWSVSVGGSKLFGQTFSDTPITTTTQMVTVGNASFGQVTSNPTSPTASVRY